MSAYARSRTLVALAALLLAACSAAPGTESAPLPSPTMEEASGAPLPTEPPASAATDPVETEPPEAGPAEPEASPTPEPTPVVNVETFPPLNAFRWEPVVTGLDRPLGLVDPGDGSGRLFVLEQPGIIRVILNGEWLPDPFMDIRDRVGSRANEQGLLGMDVQPDFAESGIFYLNYTDRNGNTVIARYRTAEGDPSRGDPGSEQVLLRVEQPFANHNGGGVLFGPDGYLYLSLGDGGSGGDPQGNAQNPDVLLGKLLRIDVVDQETYAIPPDNPFVEGGGAAEIYALGLRNPWRFSFDTATGDLYIADVGQNAWEEIDFWPAGSPPGPNFGWDYMEGNHPFEGTPPDPASLVPPVWEYSRDLGCSVTGGYVYRGQRFPELLGIYLYSDYCNGTTFGLLRGPDGAWSAQPLIELNAAVSSFGQDRQGELYLFSHREGTLYRLERSAGGS